MGVTYIDGVARGPTGKEEPVRFLVDSGATYSLLPNSVWEALGLEPTRELTFTLADGTMVQRRISRCYLVLPLGEDYTPVILGEPGDQALLGVVTFEILGLVLNPFNRILQPIRLMLA
jgi:predicted aspartyl protease